MDSALTETDSVIHAFGGLVRVNDLVIKERTRTTDTDEQERTEKSSWSKYTQEIIFLFAK